MSASLRSGGTGLKAFRLLDIPISIRQRAAASALARSDSALVADEAGVAGLLARLSRAPVGEKERDAIRRAVEQPSDRVYFVSREAWEKVMGGADAA